MKVLKHLAIITLILTGISIPFSAKGDQAKDTSDNLPQTQSSNFELPQDYDSFVLAVDEVDTVDEVEKVEAPVVTKPAIQKSVQPVPAPAPAPTPPPLSSGSCPVSTQSCVPCLAGEQYCRTKMGETSGYLGFACQTNNPGNILAPSDSLKAYKDNIIVNNGGTASCGVLHGSNNYKYMIFSSYEVGMNSLKAYIKGINNGEHSAYVNTQTNCAGPETFTCGNCTMKQFFCKFAGTPTYAGSIVSKMGGGVTEQTLLSWVVANRLDDMVNAIKKTEGFFTQ